MVFGSFPGAASLAAAQYYAHPRNLFWPILSTVLGFEASYLPELPYPARLQVLLGRGLGLWDVFDSCYRRGSLDSAIRQEVPSQIGNLRQRVPRLQTVAFNGRKAAAQGAAFQAAGYRVLELPSTSPAYAALPFATKLQRWQTLNDVLTSDL